MTRDLFCWSISMVMSAQVTLLSNVLIFGFGSLTFLLEVWIELLVIALPMRFASLFWLMLWRVILHRADSFVFGWTLISQNLWWEERWFILKIWKKGVFILNMRDYPFFATVVVHLGIRIRNVDKLKMGVFLQRRMNSTLVHGIVLWLQEWVRGKKIRSSQIKWSVEETQVSKEEEGDDELSWTHHQLINRQPAGKSSTRIVGQQPHDSIRNSNVLENSKSLDSIKFQFWVG